MGGFRQREKARGICNSSCYYNLKPWISVGEIKLYCKKFGVAVTFSSIGRRYVGEEWIQLYDKHLPYQIYGVYLMGNAVEIHTPKGLFATRDVTTHMNYFIAIYKGGRNESFM